MMRVWCKVFAKTQNRGPDKAVFKFQIKYTVGHKVEACQFVDKQALNFPMILRVSNFCKAQTGRIHWKEKMAVTTGRTRNATTRAQGVCFLLERCVSQA